MKKVLVFLLAALILITGCSSNTNKATVDSGKQAEEPAAEQKVADQKVTIWAWDPNFNIKALNLAKESYSKQGGTANVEIVEYAQADIIQKLNTGLNSGTTSGLPTIVLIEDYRAQTFLRSYPDAFFDLSTYIDAADFAEYKVGPTSLDGKQYGVPFDSGVTGLYVRTDYLQDAGFTPADLTGIDWAKFIDIAKVVKEKTGKKMISLDPNDLGIIRMMIQTAGSWYLKADGVTADLADNAALKDAFQVYKQMMEADIVNLHSDWSQFLAAFNSGTVATVPTGNWITASVKAEASQAGKWAIVPQPMLPNVDSVNASNLGGSSWYVLNVDGAEAGADFMAKTFGSDAELYQQFLSQIGAIGTFKGAAGGASYEEGDEYFSGQKIFADFATWTDQIPKVNYGIHTYAVEDILVVAMQDYLNNKDLNEVLNNAQKQADAQLK